MRRVAYWGLAVFIAAIPLQMAYYEMQAYSGSIPRLVGYAAFIVAIATIVYEGRIRSIGAIHLTAFLFMIWASLTLLWSESPDNSLTRAITYAQLGIMVWLIAQFAQTEKEQQNLILAFVVGCFVPITQLLINFKSGVALGGRAVYQMQHLRYGAFTEDPNELALGLAIGIPLAWYSFVVRKGIPKFIGWFYVALAIVPIGLTGSRGGVLSAALGTIIIVVLTFRKLDRISKGIAIGTLVVGLGAATVMIPEATVDRLELLVDFLESRERYAKTSMSEADIRWSIWVAGLERFTEDPIFGVGAGAFADAIEPVGGNRYAGHSAWVQPLTETGIVGFLFWAGTIGLCVLTVFRMKGPERALWLAVLATWGLGSTFLGNEYNKDTWMVLGFIAARAVMINKEARWRSFQTKMSGRIASASPLARRGKVPAAAG